MNRQEIIITFTAAVQFIGALAILGVSRAMAAFSQFFDGDGAEQLTGVGFMMLAASLAVLLAGLLPGRGPRVMVLLVAALITVLVAVQIPTTWLFAGLIATCLVFVFVFPDHGS